MSQKKTVSVRSYSEIAIPHLASLVDRNEAVMSRIATRLADDVQNGKSLFVFGSGHSSLFALELYHRAGGASFLIPVVESYLMPQAGPPVVRVMERTGGIGSALLSRAAPQPGEMLWIASQSGINSVGIDVALHAKSLGLTTVAFTSRVHSSSVQSRHSSGKRLMEVCDEVVDLGGVSGDACVEIGEKVNAGPLSTLGSVLLGHSILVAACAELEARGIRSVYTSVNTSEGEARNRALEEVARRRDPLLR